MRSRLIWAALAVAVVLWAQSQPAVQSYFDASGNLTLVPNAGISGGSGIRTGGSLSVGNTDGLDNQGSHVDVYSGNGSSNTAPGYLHVRDSAAHDSYLFPNVASGQWCIGATSPTNGLCSSQVAIAPTVASGTNASISVISEYYTCTGTCTITIPVPVAGNQFCVRNAAGVSTVITLAALGSSAMYEKTDGSAYGTAGTGTMVSGGAVGDKVCIVGLDSTHYQTYSFNGTWTVN